MTTTRGGACAIFYTHKEDNAPINKTPKVCTKNEILCQKREFQQPNKHVSKSKEHKVGALEVTKKMDHYKNIENKRGYEAKSLKMGRIWVKEFPKKSQTNLLVTTRRYPKKQE